jgi:hypothetical protein
MATMSWDSPEQFSADLTKAGYAKLMDMRDWARLREETGQAGWRSCREAADEEIRQRDLLRAEDGPEAIFLPTGFFGSLGSWLAVRRARKRRRT